MRKLPAINRLKHAARTGSINCVDVYRGAVSNGNFCLIAALGLALCWTDFPGAGFDQHHVETFVSIGRRAAPGKRSAMMVIVQRMT